ncbi:MAG: protein BatD [Paludibacteraceae bacterium]|nr:protein BatD [Paludibacteraceae bacterium]
MKRILSILFICSMALVAMAQDVEFKASAPAQVIMGRPFQLTYSVNQRAKDLRAPEFTDFDYIAGPYTSQSSSTSFVNGKRTSSFNLTYTYTLIANKEGTFTISPATIKVDGEQYTSNGVRIIVLPADQPNNVSAGNTNSVGQTSQRPTSSQNDNVSEANIFVRTLVSKTRVREQEAILLSYKLYFAGVDVAQFTNNTRIPEFKGFLKQEIESGEIQTELEHYNGRNYQTAVLYRTLLFPQRSGDITIEPAQFEAVLRVQNRAQVRSIFDDFFGSYTAVNKPITAPGVTIHVLDLPANKPAGFSGGVGQFNLTSKISGTELNANEAVTLTLTIQGAGNMKLLKTPMVDWPEGFEVYDPKVTNNFKNTTAGVSGTKTIEYLAIPRAGGTYTIPPVRFAYYDTQEQDYRTITTPEYTLNIERAANEDATAMVVNNFVQKENIQQLGTDIRYIHTAELMPVADASSRAIRFGSLLFWLCYAIPSLLAALLFVIFRKKIKENADMTRVRYKKANKVAQRRLKVAEQLLKQNKKDAFFEEIERAAWTYLSDRLSIPTAQLNKENIAQILSNKGVSDMIIQEMMHVLSTAEFARYAPTSDHAMQEVYEDTIKIINQLESEKL